MSPRALGRPIQVLALMTFGAESANIIDRLKNAIKTSIDVVNRFYVTGDARSMQQYEEFTRRF